MSGTQTASDQGGAAPPPAPSEEIERLARANGWRPLEDFRGDPTKWVSADTFIARGFESPAVLQERNRVLTERLNNQERLLNQTKTDLEGTLDQALTSLNTVTEMTRSAETRARERARRELKEQAAQAVTSADVATFNRVQAELDELDKHRPAPLSPPPPPAAAPPPQVRTPPEAEAFFARNPWYHQDAQLRAEADIIHSGLLNIRKDMSLEQNLAEVERRMQQQFGDRIAGRAPPAQQGNGADRHGGSGSDNDDTGGGGGATRVTPSSGGAPRQRPGRRTFDTMPKDAKDAYAKYAALLEGKGKPFTKEEYAQNYWEQFPDDGA